jgi:hypothetical protein
MIDPWRVVKGSDQRALDLVDGLGQWEGHDPHYSRRASSVGSILFTGVGKDLVMVTKDGSAVWAVVYARVPNQRNEYSGEPRYLWRNMMFRNLGQFLSSDLVRAATIKTYQEWGEKYGELPNMHLRTEVKVSKVESSNPGYCYLRAGWHHQQWKNGMRYLQHHPSWI